MLATRHVLGAKSEADRMMDFDGPARRYTLDEWKLRVFGDRPQEPPAASPHPPTSARWQDQQEYEMAKEDR